MFTTLLIYLKPIVGLPAIKEMLLEKNENGFNVYNLLAGWNKNIKVLAEFMHMLMHVLTLDEMFLLTEKCDEIGDVFRRHSPM